MNLFALAIVVLDFLAGGYYIYTGSPWMGWLWITYGAGNIILMKIAGY